MATRVVEPNERLDLTADALRAKWSVRGPAPKDIDLAMIFSCSTKTIARWRDELGLTRYDDDTDEVLDAFFRNQIAQVGSSFGFGMLEGAAHSAGVRWPRARIRSSLDRVMPWRHERNPLLVEPCSI